ncbi:MAG: HD domain-containing protein [Deltaproteobacteria bacterium]|nr:HD domain-containing protein [Deltaproteobacteria bacterium]
MKRWFKDELVLLAGLTATEIRRAETAFNGLAEVRAVQDAEGLFAELGGKKPSLIVVDIEKPSMDFRETLRRIAVDPQAKGISIIQAATEPSDLLDVPGRPPGWACFVKKPVTGVPLLEKAWVLMKLARHELAADVRETELGEARAEIARLGAEVASLKESAVVPAVRADSGSSRIARLQATLLSTVTSLVEFRDDVTGGHITRTMRWLELLLEGLDEGGLYADETRGWDRETVLQSSKLHDVGKIAISDAILKKPASLTPEEYSEMKRHAAIGGEIIDGIRASLPDPDQEFMEHAKLLAVGHHEKWDGTGYPAGLAGTVIPLQGRLMAVVDVYDALVSQRPYKDPMPHGKAAGVIADGVGTHFDPAIADVFLKLEGRFEESLKVLMR